MPTGVTTTSPQSSPSALRAIITAWLIAGCMDMLGAIIVYVYIMGVTTVTRLMQGIARGAIGRSAFDGGTPTALAGLGFHFLIALTFTIFYFIIYPFIPFLKKQKVVSGLLYGVFVWCVMNLIVLPILNIAPIPTKWASIMRGAGILMVCIGLPISLVISRYYMAQKAQGTRHKRRLYNQ